MKIFFAMFHGFVDCLTEKDLRRSLQEAALQLVEVKQQDAEEASNEGTFDVRRGSCKAIIQQMEVVKEKIHGEYAEDKIWTSEASEQLVERVEGQQDCKCGQYKLCNFFHAKGSDVYIYLKWQGGVRRH